MRDQSDRRYSLKRLDLPLELSFGTAERRRRAKDNAFETLETIEQVPRQRRELEDGLRDEGGTNWNRHGLCRDDIELETMLKELLVRQALLLRALDKTMSEEK